MIKAHSATETQKGSPLLLTEPESNYCVHPALQDQPGNH